MKIYAIELNYQIIKAYETLKPAVKAYKELCSKYPAESNDVTLWSKYEGIIMTNQHEEEL